VAARHPPAGEDQQSIRQREQHTDRRAHPEQPQRHQKRTPQRAQHSQHQHQQVRQDRFSPAQRKPARPAGRAGPAVNRKQEALLVELWRGGKHTTLDLAELFEVARSTVYRAIQRAGAPADEQEPLPPPHAPDRAT